MKSLITPYHTGRRLSVKFLASVSAVTLFILWCTAPASTSIPSPLEVGSTWATLASEKSLIHELLVSTKVIWEAIALSSLISVLIACLYTADLFKPVGTFIASLRFLGFAGLTFLFTLYTSGAHALKLSLLTFGMTVFLTRSTIDVVKSIPQSEIDYARSLGLSSWSLVWELVIRARMSDMLDLIRQNAAVGWTLLAMVEGITRSEGGIGAMLLNSNKYFNMSAVFAIQLTILAYGVLQDVLLQALRYEICPWTTLNRSDK